MYKRKILALITIIAVLTVILFSACNCHTEIIENEKTQSCRQNDGNFSVHYIDVGQGDCILIYFPDGKTMLIDVGNGESKNNKKILEFLEEFSVDRIDYLVLTHPDLDHIGGVESLMGKLQVGRSYIPHVIEKEDFPNFKKAYDLLVGKNAEIITSCTIEHIKGSDYCVAFLTPYPLGFSNSSYYNINKKYPTDSDLNNVSPIIYVEYLGVRFLFTGDAGESQENLLLDDEKVICGFFEKLGVNINLNNIDFLKVAHHGSQDSSCERFLTRIMPKNAVISVGGANSYGLPSSQVLYRLSTINPDYKLFRTDLAGTISITVSQLGEINIVTDN